MNSCRTCLRNEPAGSWHDMFTDEETPLNMQLLVTCTSLCIAKGDGLPEQMCNVCFLKLVAFQALCDQAIEAERVYRLRVSRCR